MNEYNIIIFLISLVCINPLHSEDSLDIFDRIDTMAESLQVWIVNPPPQWNADTDSINFTDLFPHARIEPVIARNEEMKQSSVIRITLPRYMNLLTTELELVTVHGDSLHDDSSFFKVPLTIEYNKLVLDDYEVLCSENIIIDSTLLVILSDRLIELRTIGLPVFLRTKAVMSNDSIMVKLRGKVTRQYTFARGFWSRVLAYLARGMQVYAGLLGIKADSLYLSADYYILLTMPEANGHHFLTIEDNIQQVENGWEIVRTIVKFIPYIRTDNLGELFAVPPEK